MRMIVNMHWGSGFVVSLQYGLAKSIGMSRE